MIGQPKQFIVKVVNPVSGKSGQITLKAKSQQAINKLAIARRKPQPINDIDLTFRHHTQTAILTINTFEISSEKFRTTIEPVFRTIKQRRIRNLIIDVRKNGGGNNSNVTRLFSYLAEKPFIHLKRAEMITHHFTYLNHIENLLDFKRLRNTSTTGSGYLMNYLYPGTSLTHPVEGLSFKGKLIVLAGGATVSAAFELVALVHAHKRGVIVGEETGGCYYGATGGRYLHLILPNSQLKVQIPTIRIYTDVPEDFVDQPKGRGTLPDYQLKPTIAAIMANKDVQLEAALKLIEKVEPTE